MNGNWLISGVQITETWETYVIRIELPDDFPGNGTEHTYSIREQADPDSATVIVTMHSTDYIADTGNITLSLKKGKMSATFKLLAKSADKEIKVHNGEIQVQMGYGNFEVDFYGNSAPLKDFEAQVLDIYDRTDLDGNHTKFIRGQVTEEFPPIRNIVTVALSDSLPPGTYSLSESETRAQVRFIRLDTYGVVMAHKGELTIESLPATGHAVGSFSCTFKHADHPEFTAQGSFDVTDSVV